MIQLGTTVSFLSSASFLYPIVSIIGRSTTYSYSRQHQTVAGEQKSAFLGINASIIQGSGLGPVFYTINASDVHPAYSSNILFKYADDTYLIVPAKYSNLIPEELHNISTWAKCQQLKIKLG